MKDSATTTSSTGQSSAMAGPPVSLRISGAGNPNMVPRGSSREKLPAADALDASGNIVPGVTGKYTLVTPYPGVTVSDALGNLNGRVNITNVQGDMVIDVRLTTDTNPQVTGIYRVVVHVVG